MQPWYNNNNAENFSGESRKQKVSGMAKLGEDVLRGQRPIQLKHSVIIKF